MTRRYQGSCLCKAITFEVGGFGEQTANCHCSMCRKFHGAAYGTLVPVSDLTWLSGREFLQDYVADNGTTRTFCKRCGSSIGFRVKGASINELEIAIALFDTEIPVTVNAQIYTIYKANWVQLEGHLPQYGEGRESGQEG